MLAIEVELLTGRYVATAYNDRGRGEWPPHPARFFSALVAALYEGGELTAEREALAWIEGLGAPELSVAIDGTGHRDVRTVFVPVNDVGALGDPGAPVRKAEEELLEVRASDAKPAEIKQAEKKLDKAMRKFDESVAGLAQVGEVSKSEVEQASAYLPERRTRKERTFPAVIPAEPTFAFLWPEADPGVHRAALQRLCERVTRLGHSSSLVRCTISRREWKATLLPTTDGDTQLRVVGPGQLQRLDAEFARHQGIDQRTLPFVTQRYGAPRPPARGSAPHGDFADGDRWIVFEYVDGARLLSSRGMALARAVRAALLEQAGELGIVVPPTVSGHAGGDPVTFPHVAFAALAFVGFQHADASIQAVAIVPPADLARADRDVLVHLVAALEDNRGDRGILTFAAAGLPPTRYRRSPSPTKRTGQPATWCRESTRFVSATPIALDRNPGNLRSNAAGTAHRAAIEAQRIIAAACEVQKLPRPTRIEIGFSPFAMGAQPAQSFDARTKRSGLARVRVHADVEFEHPVRGPVLLGATRFFGGGLFLPVAGATRRESDA